MKKRILSFALALVMVLMTVPAMAVTTASAAMVLTNVAEGISAKDGRGYNADSMTDGNTSDYHDLGYWGKTDGDPSSAYGTSGSCYIEIDLGTSYDVEKLKVYTLTDRDYRFTLYGTNDVSADVSTWTELGAKTDSAKMTSEGFEIVLDEKVNCRYVRAYGMYNAANLGFHFTEIQVWAMAAEKNELDVSPWAVSGGMENWASGTQGDGILVTQILMEVKDSVMATDGKTWNGALLSKEIKDGNFSTQLVINGGGLTNKVLNVNPATYYDKAFRFEPCVAEDPFVPLKGQSYKITLNILDKEGNVYASGTNTWKCNMNPIAVYDGDEVKVEQRQVSGYGNQSEFKGGYLIMTPQSFPGVYFTDDDTHEQAGQNYVLEMEIGNAIYPINPTKNYTWSADSIMAGVKLIAEGFTPVAGQAYDIVYKGYTYSVPSGKKVQVGLFTTSPSKQFVLQNYTNNNGLVDVEGGIPYVYEIDAENGKVVVEFDEAGKTYTLTANAPDKGCRFSHWEVDGEAIDVAATTYSFAAVEGAKKEIVAVYEVVKDITIEKVYNGWENWSNNTQLLLKIYDFEGNKFTSLWDKRNDYVWELTINGEKCNVTPSSEYLDWALYRFAVCVDEVFVPVSGAEYQVSLTIYEKDGQTVAYKSTNTVTTTCTNLNGSLIVPIHDHVCPEGDEIEVPATTVAPGSNTYICEKCHGEITEELAQLDKVAGDMDADGKVSISDVTKLLSVIAGTDTLHEELNGDLDGDDVISISDVTKLLVMISEQEKQ